MLILFAHDGDNDFGGGYSYYMQCVQGFVNQAVSQGYNPTTIQQYLNDFPLDENGMHRSMATLAVSSATVPPPLPTATLARRR